MPEEAFAHFKEAANLAPEDVVAQWEAYESRVSLERSRGAKNAAGLPKEAVRYVATLAQRLDATSKSEQTDARLASEVLGVILAQGTKPADAMPYLDAARGEPPKPRVELLRFRVLLALGKTSEALPLGEEVIKNAFIPEIALEVAAAADSEGNTELASATVVEGLKRYPSSIELRLARAVILMRDPEAKELSEAGQLLESLSSTSDEEALVHDIKFVRAIFYGLIGETPLAHRLLDQLDKTWADRVAKARQALDSNPPPSV
jgi:tetratricopeptide (TPR) repeat protein